MCLSLFSIPIFFALRNSWVISLSICTVKTLSLQFCIIWLKIERGVQHCTINSSATSISSHWDYSPHSTSSHTIPLQCLSNVTLWIMNCSFPYIVTKFHIVFVNGYTAYSLWCTPYWNTFVNITDSVKQCLKSTESTIYRFFFFFQQTAISSSKWKENEIETQSK